MKKLLPIALFSFAFFSLYSQNDLASILTSGNNFKKMCNKADAYFEQKHPGLTAKSLTSGEHRDGEFVKYMRWRHFWESSLNPDGTLGDLSAYHRQKSKKASTDTLYQDIEWTNVSNTEFIRLQISMGRTTSIAFHPTDINIFYVGAAIGGIWKTEDGGQTYRPLGDDLPFLAVSSIVVDHQDPNILYISVGDHVWNGLPSIGVYKSTDAGLTWNPTSLIFSTSENRRINWITANPLDNASLFVATDAGLYKTNDGFETITQLTTTTCTQVLYKYGDINTVYLADDEGQFFKSVDGGETFSLIEDFGTRNVRMALTEREPEKIVIAHANSLLESMDSGDSFVEVTSLPETNNAQQVAINPNDPNDYVLGYFELFRTKDAGVNFTQICDWLGRNDLPLVHVDMRNVQINPLQKDRIYFCHDGGLDVYNLETEEFTNLSDGLIITQFYDIAVSQSEPNVISGGSQDNGSMYRDENGVWDDLAGTGDGMITEIDPNNKDVIFWEFQFGGMRRFSGTNTSNISPTGEDGNGAWITPYRLDPSNSERIIVGYGNVYESLNQGDTWTRISNNLDDGANLDHIAIAETDGQRIYAINDESLFVKAIDSDIWTTKSLPVNGGVTDIEVNPLDMDKIIITVGGYTNNSKVYASDNAGDTWINLSENLPNVRFGAIEFYKDIENSFFVGSEAGVYYRDDSAAGWFSYGQLPNTRVNDIELQYSAQKIRIGTYGRGVYEADIEIAVCNQNSPDQDGDGICDTFDSCPDLDDTQIGTLCDDGDPLSSNETFTTNCICEGGQSNLAYCSAEGSNGTGSDFINLVELGSISNPTGKTSYSDFRNLSTELIEGRTYNLTIGLGFSFDQDTSYAWIDYNRSGTFEESELIEMSDFDANHQNTATFTVPELMEFGATTMRVRNIFSNNPTADACGNYFGEVEDYTIQLRDSSTLVDLDQDGYFSDVDCDDNNPEVFPGQIETPYNSIDDDCDINTLDDDLDQDGFTLAEDCDDTNENINPDAIEIANNGIDEDCDGSDLATSTYNLGNTTIDIFPNPASEIVNIRVTRPLNYQVNLYDLNGKNVLSSTNARQIKVNGYPKGLYFLELKDVMTKQRIVDRILII